MRKNQLVRAQKGMTLLEMVVSIGLSGIFVVLLSGMLSETLSLSTSSQNDLIAGAAAESLIESAKVLPMTILQIIHKEQT